MLNFGFKFLQNLLLRLCHFSQKHTVVKLLILQLPAGDGSNAGVRGVSALGKERLKHAAGLLGKIVLNPLWVEMCVLPCSDTLALLCVEITSGEMSAHIKNIPVPAPSHVLPWALYPCKVTSHRHWVSTQSSIPTGKSLVVDWISMIC